MTVFDQFVLSVFNHYKPVFKTKANIIAVVYISLLQSSILLLLGVFFAAFFQQMKVSTMSSDKAWILFGVSVIGIYFKNWINYSGKKRTLLNAKRTKQKHTNYNVWILWLIPLACISLAILLLQVV